MVLTTFHIVLETLPPSIFKLKLHPLNTPIPQSFLPLAPGNQHSTFYLSMTELIQYLSFCVIGLFHLAWCL